MQNEIKIGQRVATENHGWATIVAIGSCYGGRAFRYTVLVKPSKTRVHLSRAEFLTEAQFQERARILNMG